MHMFRAFNVLYVTANDVRRGLFICLHTVNNKHRRVYVMTFQEAEKEDCVCVMKAIYNTETKTNSAK